MQTKQNWPCAETQEIQSTASKYLPWHSSHSGPHSRVGGRNTDVSPQQQTQFNSSLLSSHLLKNSYSCLASGTVITKPGRDWTLLKLENFRKDLGASFFFFFPFLSPPYNKNQQFCRSDLHFLISKKCTCQNTCEPQHVRGNSSLQFALEKHQALIIKLLIHREDAAPPLSEQLQKDQDLVLKEM